MNITDIVAEKDAEIADMDVMITNKNTAIDGYALDMSNCLASIDKCQMQIDGCFADVSTCSMVVCDEMREMCGLAINVEVPMDIDSALIDTIVESEFELWATMPCFAYHTLRNVAANLDDTTWESEAADEASCWDTCDVEPGCMAAVYNGTTCWHTATVLKPNNVEYEMGYSTLVPCMQRNESMYEKLEDEADHMGKVILYYNLALNACSTCTGYNKLVDIDTVPGVQIGDANMNVSESECWNSCVDYPDSGCSTAVYDGMNCYLKNETVSNTTSRYSPGSHSLYACAPITATAPPTTTTDRGIVAEFIQFKLDVNDQSDCTDFNRLDNTDVATGVHILQACQVPTIEDCFDTCMAFTGGEDGPCLSAVYSSPHCWLKNVTVTVDTGTYAENFTTIYPCEK
jgi:hypothetical protein